MVRLDFMEILRLKSMKALSMLEAMFGGSAEFWHRVFPRYADFQQKKKALSL
jgi:hypothetical protein